ncbi:MAG: hypothetical protein ACTSYR_01725 [Candidatus Odinarchaeia archaeon]
MENIGENLKKLKKEILNLLIGDIENKEMSKKDVLFELEKPLIKVKEDLDFKLCDQPPENFNEKLTLSKNDLNEFLTVLDWFKIPEEHWCITNPEPDLYYFYYQAEDESIKNVLKAFFDLFAAKYVRMLVKQKITFSKKQKWKWNEVLALFEEGLKTK